MGVKLGQKWAVKDGNLLASNQVGSRFFNKEFDFSRASNGTYIDRDGLLKTAELYNLMPYSEDFSQWTTQSGITLEQTTETYDPNGQYNAYKVISTNPSSGFYRTGLSINFDVTRSIYLKGVNGGETCQFKDGGGFGGVVNLTLTTEWVRYEFTTLYSGGTFQGMFIDDISSDIYVYGAQLVLGTEPLAYQYTNGLQGLPRISFEDGVGHLLLEPQRSNLLLQSNNYNNWTKDYVTLTSGQSGIYGSNDAWKIVATATNSVHRIVSNSVTGNSIQTFSVYAKAAEYDHIRIVENAITGDFVTFDLTNGLVKNNTGITDSAFIVSEGNGWYRCGFSVDTGATSRMDIYAMQDASTQTYLGDDVSGIYIQHAQLESGSYPTSIIETTTTQITRLADVCNNSGSAQDFNSEEGVLYAEVAALADDSESKRITISDGDLSDRITLSLASDIISGFINVANVSQYTFFESGQNITDYNKIAIKYKENDFAVWINGVEYDIDTSGITFPKNTLLVIDFDNATGSNPFYGKVRNVQVFTEALSDAELQQLTT
jgi:hypothetical protein